MSKKTERKILQNITRNLLMQRNRNEDIRETWGYKK